MKRREWPRCPETGKHRYGSERLALAKLEAIQSDPTPGADDYRPVRAYLCPACNKWHLTSMPEWVEV